MKEGIEIIAKIETLLGELKSSLGVKSIRETTAASPVKSDAIFSGLTNDINNLIQEGFFKEPRTIAEIQAKLRLEGINKPTTSLMRPLLILIKKKAIARSKPAKGPFKYHHR